MASEIDPSLPEVSQRKTEKFISLLRDPDFRNNLLAVTVLAAGFVMTREISDHQFQTIMGEYYKATGQEQPLVEERELNPASAY